MCDYDDFPGPDIDPDFFRKYKVPKIPPLDNPFYEPYPGEIENEDDDFDEEL